jgi:hypothetical protein
MRLSLVSLGVAMALAACGPSGTPPSNTPSLEPRSAGAVRIYQGVMPRCGYRELGQVAGRDYRDLQSRAFSLRANAVILDPQSSKGAPVYAGMAVAFTRVDCQQ